MGAIVLPVTASAGLASAESPSEPRESAAAQSPFLAALAAAMLAVPPKPQQLSAVGIAIELKEEGGAASEGDQSDAAEHAPLAGQGTPAEPAPQDASPVSEKASAESELPQLELRQGDVRTPVRTAGAGAESAGAIEAEAASAETGDAGTVTPDVARAASLRSEGTRAEDTPHESDVAADPAQRDQAMLALMQAAYLTYASAPRAADARPGGNQSAQGQSRPDRPARAGTGLSAHAAAESPGVWRESREASVESSLTPAAAVSGIAVSAAPIEEAHTAAAARPGPELPQGTAVVQLEVASHAVARHGNGAPVAVSPDAPGGAVPVPAAAKSEVHVPTSAAGQPRAPGVEEPMVTAPRAARRDQRESSDHTGSDHTGSDRRFATAVDASAAALASSGHGAAPSAAAEAPRGATPASAQGARLADDSATPARGPVDRITLQLPDDLGGARIHVAVRAGVVAARIVTPDAELGRRLEAGLNELQGALVRQGFDEVKLAVPAPRAAVPAGAEAAAVLPVASTGASDAGDARQRSSTDAQRQPSREDGANPFGGRGHSDRQQQRSRRERER